MHQLQGLVYWLPNLVYRVWVRVATACGGSANNSQTRVFEGKVQDPKRTLTNGKDTHMHVVAKQNMEQAFQYMASGGSWDAVELSPNGKEVIAVHSVKAGPKLLELIKAKYPQLNPVATSVATVKSQVSSIAVQDLDVMAHLKLDPSVVQLRDLHELASAHRAAPVLLSHPTAATGIQPQPVLLYPPGDLSGAIAAPRFEALAASLLYFGGGNQSFPEGAYEEGTLRAYRRCLVYSPGAVGDPRRQLQGQIRGWPKGVSRGGSKVKVQLPNSR